MDMSSPSKLRLPHASAGPFWCPPAPLEPRNEWRELAGLSSAPYDDERPRGIRSVNSFAFVAAALTIGTGVLAWTLIGSRNDCGAGCHVVTATAGPTGEAAPHPVATAGLAPRPDTPVAEGRSVAEPAPDAGVGAADLAPAVPRAKHRHRRHHHSAVAY